MLAEPKPEQEGYFPKVMVSTQPTARHVGYCPAGMGAPMKHCYHKNMDTRMFDFADFYTSMAAQLPDGAVIAEVGVADGASGIFMAESLANLGKKFTLHLIDSLAYGGANQLQTIIGHVQKSGLGEFIRIVPHDSLNASCQFPDGYFDFVFIDASHLYENTKADVRLWYRKVKESSWLAGHDYHGCPPVKQAVDEVVPMQITRPEIPGQQVFLPEQVLFTEPTTGGNGLWLVQKKFYLNLL